MTELLTSTQMRAVEKAAIDSGETTGLALMERAGQGAVKAILAEWPCLAEAAHRAVVLCGPGNNGGDGFVVARLLKKAGWQVSVYLYGEAAKLPPDARVNYEQWSELGEVEPLDAGKINEGWKCDLLVDALFGTGLTRPLPALGKLFRNMEDMCDGLDVEIGHDRGRPAIVAIDIPSGLHADSGRALPHADGWSRFAATAHLTVTFHSPKLGHFLADGPDHTGKLTVVDIGLTPSEPKAAAVCNLVDAVHPSWFEKHRRSHKFEHGHALILSGGPGRTGASRLAARAALRVGAGLVTLGVSPAAQMEVAGHITAIMLRRVADAEALSAVLEDRRINALCLGPGLGLGDAQAKLVGSALRCGQPCVLDADALTLLSASKPLFDQLHASCILTPHEGEFARLFPDLAKRLGDEPGYAKTQATREAAARAGCVVLFKGPDTVIAAPDGQCNVHAASGDRSAPWLATAGSGDVLAGLITGLLARGLVPSQAAAYATCLHVEAARSFGPGLIAEDLPEQLPKVFREMGV